MPYTLNPARFSTGTATFSNGVDHIPASIYSYETGGNIYDVIVFDRPAPGTDMTWGYRVNTGAIKFAPQHRIQACIVTHFNLTPLVMS